MTRMLPLLALLMGITSAAAQDKPITLHGDAALTPVIEALNKRFTEAHPGVAFALDLKGSATAVPALASGATPIGFTIGDATRADLRAFKAINKHEALAVKIGYAGYGPRAGGKTPPAVYVNAANPLQGLTMAQLAGLFTSGSPGGDINTWHQLGVTGTWATRRVHLYGQRDDGNFSTSLRLAHLGGMPFAGHYEGLADDAAVLQAVSQDPYGIAIVDWTDAGAAPNGVRIVPLATANGKPFVAPDKADVAKGAYPLTAAITLYAAPNMAPWVRDYLATALSDQGQAIIAAHAEDAMGLLPLSADDVQAERDKLKH